MPVRVACLATQGNGSFDEQRILGLCRDLDPVTVPFDAQEKRTSARTLTAWLRRERPACLVMEGTGLAGGLPLLRAAAGHRQAFVVSSGDAVAPFITLRSRALAAPALAYEAALCRGSAGFIGWTPYLTGRALTLGAPRAMTAPGWAPEPPRSPELAAAWRREVGIGEGTIVIAIAGSLEWVASRNYCYGLELVEALLRVPPDRDVRAVIIGDGSGLQELRRRAGDDPRVTFTGRVPRSEVARALAAADLASLPQSLDGVGMFRYSTKLVEYLAQGAVPVCGELPMSYDVLAGACLRIGGGSPWDPAYHRALAQLLGSTTRESLVSMRERGHERMVAFDEATQRAAVTAFVGDILRARGA